MNLATCPFGTGRFDPFNQSGLFKKFRDLNENSELQEDDCLIVWGGADISPSLYNKKVSRLTGADEIPSHRDAFEWHFMQQAMARGVPIIGICRGAQMLCAAAGGTLIQDVDGHAGQNHRITTYDGKTLTVNSLHHQMMNPGKVDHELIAWSSNKLSVDRKGNPNYTDVNDEGDDIQVEMPIEPEFIYFPKIKGFAVQWHPEFMSGDTPATHYIFNFMKERIGQHDSVAV